MSCWRKAANWIRKSSSRSPVFKKHPNFYPKNTVLWHHRVEALCPLPDALCPVSCALTLWPEPDVNRLGLPWFSQSLFVRQRIQTKNYMQEAPRPACCPMELWTVLFFIFLHSIDHMSGNRQWEMRGKKTTLTAKKITLKWRSLQHVSDILCSSILGEAALPQYTQLPVLPLLV